jgi:AcrR family transcriptional regulator
MEVDRRARGVQVSAREVSFGRDATARHVPRRSYCFCALFGSKQAVLAACIKERAARMCQPLEPAVPVPTSRAAVAATLVQLGTSILRVVCHHDVLTVHRLAIAESDRTPEIARTLDRNGREANHLALAGWLAKGASARPHRRRRSGRDGGALPRHIMVRIADSTIAARARDARRPGDRVAGACRHGRNTDPLWSAARRRLKQAGQPEGDQSALASAGSPEMTTQALGIRLPLSAGNSVVSFCFIASIRPITLLRLSR